MVLKEMAGNDVGWQAGARALGDSSWYVRPLAWAASPRHELAMLLKVMYGGWMRKGVLLDCFIL